MKHFIFRCVKITFEERKEVRLIKRDEAYNLENTVQVQLEQANELTGPLIHGHGHIGLYLSDAQYKELNYQVGQTYVLVSTQEALDSAMLTEDEVTLSCYSAE